MRHTAPTLPPEDALAYWTPPPSIRPAPARGNAAPPGLDQMYAYFDGEQTRA